ncbi:hypothetical protein XI25_19255 [Paenibacillus sp. DMB20]|nr:hypothetical protein XI25_19255 [Paenibacillus sp. DMB20]
MLKCNMGFPAMKSAVKKRLQRLSFLYVLESYDCSALPEKKILGSMLLLTSHSELYSVFRIFFLLGVCEISPGKSDNLPLTHLPHLQDWIRVVLDFALLCKLVRPILPCM